MLAINLVTRGRPERLIETVRRTLPNISLHSTRLMISIDDDDQATIDRLGAAPLRLRPCIQSIEPREDTVGGKVNRVLKVFPDATVYLPMVDYAPHITPGFDAKILEAAALFPDNIGLVVNHNSNFSFSGINGVTKGLSDHLGYIYPELFPYWFIDHWIEDISLLIGRRSFADVRIDGKDKPPTQELRELPFWCDLFDMTRLVRRRQAMQVLPQLSDTNWRRTVMRNSYPLVEYRSAWIIGQMRKQAFYKQAFYGPVVDNGPGGERYGRLKAQAIEIARVEGPKLLKEQGLTGTSGRG